MKFRTARAQANPSASGCAYQVSRTSTVVRKAPGNLLSPDSTHHGTQGQQQSDFTQILPALDGFKLEIIPLASF